MNEIKLRIDDKDLTRMLKKAASRGENMKPIMGKVSALMLSSIQQNFIEEGRPQKWTPLSAVTKRLRAEKGHWPGPMLRVSQGGLFSSLQAEHDETSALVGTAKVYSAIQNMGGQTGRGRKVTIPAREYMNITDDDMEEMVDTIGGYLTKG